MEVGDDESNSWQTCDFYKFNCPSLAFFFK